MRDRDDATFARMLLSGAVAYTAGPDAALGQEPSERADDGPRTCSGGGDQEQNEAAIAKLPEHYRFWLDEDVVYIVTPEERCAFLLLTTDQEREHS